MSLSRKKYNGMFAEMFSIKAVRDGHLRCTRAATSPDVEYGDHMQVYISFLHAKVLDKRKCTNEGINNNVKTCSLSSYLFYFHESQVATLTYQYIQIFK